METKILNIGDFPSINSHRIFLYGAGKVAMDVREIMCYLGIEICAHIVSKRGDNPFYLWEKRVLLLSDVSFNENDIIILALNEKYHIQIINMLSELHLAVYTLKNINVQDFYNKKKHSQLLRWKRYFQPYYEMLDLYCNEHGFSESEQKTYIENSLEGFSRKLHISRLVVQLGTKCSLRCKDCSNLMQYYRPQMDLNINKITEAIDTLLAISYNILRVEFIGGEPFCAQNLGRALEFAINQKKIGTIEITTNGTIFPDKEIHSLLRNDKVKIYVSNYPNIEKQKKVKEYLFNNNIPYKTLSREKWVVPGGIEKRNKTPEKIRNEYMLCNAGYNCKTLYEDKLFSCARAANLYGLGVKEIEYLQIDSGLSCNSFIEFISRDKSVACDYCDVASEERKYTNAAIQMKGTEYIQ